ncbi:GH23006 [Drosophila grimshawi]|uniref:GH23006 n=1 Tax=Drosophila grimshawi TaxID=7222 RepID=B4JWB6_DROGR|nr:GH23006 [Drosophila grimshawi]
MTTNSKCNQNWASNQYLKKLLPKVKRKKEQHQQQQQVNNNSNKTQTRTITGRYLSPAAHWLPNENSDGIADNGKGSPYVLLSVSDSANGGNAAATAICSCKKRRSPTCHNVLHEPRLRLDPPSIVMDPLVRGIRISICVEHTRFPLIGKVAKGIGLTHVPEHRLWNVQWCDNTPHFDLLKSMKRFQQINHFPGMSEICRKDLLSRNLNRMLKMYPGDYCIFPKTWLLPTDAYDVAVYASRHKRTFILKPYSSGQGRGIWLTNNLQTVGRQEKLICQTYIERPLLIDGFKFDLRVYTLVTSVDPLRIFVYNEGLARFATNKYKPPALGNSDNMFMHLTNYCVNRRNCNYNAGCGIAGGFKRKLSAYNRWLVEHNYNVVEFWASVDDAIIKTLISAWPVLRHNYQLCFPKHNKIQACFQLLGFDILVDWKLKPYILEVNHTPSLMGGERVDLEVKRPLIKDTLNLISTPLVDKEEIIREDRALLRDRLMQQANRRRVEIPPKIAPSEQQRAAGGADVSQACSLSALAQQIAWEESHMGNYRRIMPPTDAARHKYYFKFYNQFKQVSPFKETNHSHSRIKDREQLRQQTLQEQLQDKHEQLQRRKEKQLIARHKLQQQRSKERAVGIWQMLNKRQFEITSIRQDRIGAVAKGVTETPTPAKSTTNEAANNDKLQRFKRKRSLACVSARRQRQLQCQQRRTRLLEWESRQDAEFLVKHSIAASSSNVLLANEKSNNQQQPNNNHNNNDEANKEKLVAKKKLNKHWLPDSIDESDKQLEAEWRSERTTAVNGRQLQELFFHEMYERGNLTKNDINLFPTLLYRILTAKMNEVNASY